MVTILTFVNYSVWISFLLTVEIEEELSVPAMANLGCSCCYVEVINAYVIGSGYSECQERAELQEGSVSLGPLCPVQSIYALNTSGQSVYPELTVSLSYQSLQRGLCTQALNENRLFKNYTLFWGGELALCFSAPSFRCVLKVCEHDW